MSFAPISMKVSDSISAYRIVQISASHTVAVADTTTVASIGITQDQATSANQAVPVAVSGLARVYMNGTCGAGALITHDAQGRGVAATGATAGTYVVGRVLEAVSSTGTIAHILVNPFVLFDVP